MYELQVWFESPDVIELSNKSKAKIEANIKVSQ
jgi:hypothetical protein